MLTSMIFVMLAGACFADNAPALKKAFIDGSGSDWQTLGEGDFVNVNCNSNTWEWKDDVLYCTGKPTGVASSKNSYTNFEFVVEWRHMKYAGNSGVFVWASGESLDKLREGKGRLPNGIEVQMLDIGYEDRLKKGSKKKPGFTSHGDVFPVRVKMKPFPPLSPNGSRSFPSKRLSKGAEQWNHYYVRCINGEIRLWVNSEEVSGGTDCKPKSGYLALESEGSPIEFRNIKIRVLP